MWSVTTPGGILSASPKYAVERRVRQGVIDMTSELKKDQAAIEYIRKVQQGLKDAVEPVALLHHQAASEGTRAEHKIAQAKSTDIQRHLVEAMTALDHLAQVL